MRSKFATAGVVLAAFVLVATVAAAAAKTNFGGTWVMDAAKSEGVRPGTEVTMTVKQDGDKLEVERKIKDQRGDNTSNDTYTADGKEGEFTMQMMGNSTKGKRTTKWLADGAALEIKETASFDRQGTTVNVETLSKWSLSADGKTLTVEQTRTSPQGEQKSKRVFNKQ